MSIVINKGVGAAPPTGNASPVLTTTTSPTKDKKVHISIKEDPEKLYQLVENIGTGSYGEVFKVGFEVEARPSTPPPPTTTTPNLTVTLSIHEYLGPLYKNR